MYTNSSDVKSTDEPDLVWCDTFLVAVFTVLLGKFAFLTALEK